MSASQLAEGLTVHFDDHVAVDGVDLAVEAGEVVAVLGASPVQVWREVDLPLVRRAIFVAAGFAFAISLGEFGATTVIARADTPTVPVAIDRLLGRPGSLNVSQAFALSVVLMVLTASAVLAVDRARRRDGVGRGGGWV